MIMRMVTFGSLLAAAIYALNAHAGQQTTSMTVDAEVIEVCSISASSISFGSGTTTQLIGTTQSTQIAVSCPDNMDWTVSLGGDTEERTYGRMLRYIYPPDEPMYFEAIGFEYALKHIDSTNPVGTLWGDGSSTKLGDPVSGVGEKVLVAQASILSQLNFIPLPNLPAGQYTDTVTVTLDY